MSFLKNSKPSYFYVGCEGVAKNRVQFQKHKLKNILQDYDENLTEVQNMLNNGYEQMFDIVVNVCS